MGLKIPARSPFYVASVGRLEIADPRASVAVDRLEIAAVGIVGVQRRSSVGSRICHGGALPDPLIIGHRDAGEDGQPVLVVEDV
jgi:hypothetical protein